jgi:hypothetical protein
MSTAIDKEAFKRFINNAWCDFEKRNWTKADLLGGSLLSPVDLLPILQEWQSAGYLRILKSPVTVTNDDICVEILTYIERSPFDPPKK